MTNIYIGNRKITNDCEPFIIAEAGINHNGDLQQAFRMIEAAKKVGADCIKFQTFSAEEFIGDPTQTYTYMSQGKEITESMQAMFKRYEFSRFEWQAIKNKCDDVGIIFLSTPQNLSDLELLLNFGVEAVKVGSDDFTNLPLLKAYSATGLPLILSCGMATLAEVYQSLETVGTFEGYPTILLLCTSQYPTPPVEANLNRLNTLAHIFPGLVLGFSDHTQGIIAAPVAHGLGAVVFEKHFTLDHNMPGPDHWFSEDVNGLAQWVEGIRVAHEMLGSHLVRPTIGETTMKLIARRSIVALNDISAGEPLGSHNLGFKRPGNGLSPAMYDQILGCTATRELKKGDLLRIGDFK